MEMEDYILGLLRPYEDEVPLVDRISNIEARQLAHIWHQRVEMERINIKLDVMAKALTGKTFTRPPLELIANTHLVYKCLPLATNSNKNDNKPIGIPPKIPLSGED